MEIPKWITLRFDSGRLSYPRGIMLESERKNKPKAIKSYPIFIHPKKEKQL